MHYLVTGGCGFIGSHLAQALVSAGHSVRILDNLSSGERSKAPAQADIIVGDVADAATVAKAVQGIDGIFHLAAIASVQQCNEQWLDSHRTNLTGTITIFEAACKAAGGPVPVVYASSAAVYGDNDHLPLNEEGATVPLTPYGQDKLACEHYARVGARIHQLPSVGLRFFNVFGPGQDPRSPYSGVISRFIEAAHKGSDVTLFGDGEQTRDFIYVGDIVKLLTLSMEYAAAHKNQRVHAVVNGATGHSHSLLSLLTTLETIVEKRIGRIFAEARAGDIRHSRGYTNHAKQLLGFVAETSFETGLRATLASLEARHG